MASEDRGGWRCHAAILFANLSNSPFAMETIRRLGEVSGRDEEKRESLFRNWPVAIAMRLLISVSSQWLC